MITCKNCSLEFDAKFCPDCGQKASTKRFSTRILFSEFLDKVIPLDKGVLFTARRLFTSPGQMLRGYLEGKRVGYTKPLQFLLIITAISLIFFSQDEFRQGLDQGMTVSETTDGSGKAAAEVFKKQFNDFISSHLTLIVVGMIPFLALTSKWFYKKYDLNYAEHFVMNCYLLSACSIISMPFVGLLRLNRMNAFSIEMTYIFIGCYVGYYVWAHVSFYREPNRIWNSIKAMLTFLLGYLLYILFVGILGVVAVMIYLSFFVKTVSPTQ